jgi:hypothetical protein
MRGGGIIGRRMSHVGGLKNVYKTFGQKMQQLKERRL